MVEFSLDSQPRKLVNIVVRCGPVADCLLLLAITNATDYLIFNVMISTIGVNVDGCPGLGDLAARYADCTLQR